MQKMNTNFQNICHKLVIDRRKIKILESSKFMKACRHKNLDWRRLKTSRWIICNEYWICFWKLKLAISIYIIIFLFHKIVARMCMLNRSVGSVGNSVRKRKKSLMQATVLRYVLFFYKLEFYQKCKFRKFWICIINCK